MDLNKVVPLWQRKLEEKVKPDDEDAESSKSGCRSTSRAHGKAYEQVPALIYTRREAAYGRSM